MGPATILSAACYFLAGGPAESAQPCFLILSENDWNDPGDWPDPAIFIDGVDDPERPVGVRTNGVEFGVCLFGPTHLIESYHWDFGDGSTLFVRALPDEFSVECVPSPSPPTPPSECRHSLGWRVLHWFPPSGGIFEVTLTVTNFSGVSGSVSVLLDVPFRWDLYRRGDANDDGVVNLSDVFAILRWRFLGEDIGCPAASYVSGIPEGFPAGNGVQDAISLLNWLFRGGPAPPAPGPFECGGWRSSDWGCDDYRSC